MQGDVFSGTNMPPIAAKTPSPLSPTSVADSHATLPEHFMHFERFSKFLRATRASFITDSYT